MMYVCDRCGELCDEDDLPTYTEDFGYDTGVGWRSCPQTFVDNCSCGGNFIEADKCELCDEYCSPDDTYGGVCEFCLKDNVSYENAIKIGDENKESVEINGFLAKVFTTEQIETILEREYDGALKTELLKSKTDKEIEDYCLDDKTFFGEWLKEQ